MRGTARKAATELSNRGSVVELYSLFEVNPSILRDAQMYGQTHCVTLFKTLLAGHGSSSRGRVKSKIKVQKNMPNIEIKTVEKNIQPTHFEIFLK